MNFFGEVFEEKLLKDSSPEKMLHNFFKEKRESQIKAIVALHSNTTFEKLFMKYSSAILCSAAKKCLFPFGEDVRKPEKFDLNNGHFKMLVF